MVIFSENSSWTKSFGLVVEEKSLVLIIYDESIFNTNDEKKKI